MKENEVTVGYSDLKGGMGSALDRLLKNSVPLILAIEGQFWA